MTCRRSGYELSLLGFGILGSSDHSGRLINCGSFLVLFETFFYILFEIILDFELEELLFWVNGDNFTGSLVVEQLLTKLEKIGRN